MAARRLGGDCLPKVENEIRRYTFELARPSESINRAHARNVNESLSGKIVSSHAVLRIGSASVSVYT